MDGSDLLTIGTVSRRAGIAASALRFYDREGLVPSVRSPGGQRRYPRSALRRIAFIRAAQNVGLTLDEIREALATLPEGRPPTVDDWERLSASWRSRLDDQIEALQALRGRLTSCIGCGCLSLGACALMNPGDSAGRGGPGARYLPAPLRRAHGAAGAAVPAAKD
ncbi:MAG TPA: redox-sensitive transcriptional activator SoxR [Miltoncostaea sp.]|nr:redox-sensitive transcriptional activator SoxR [Miltoncostaea sp.]